MAVEQPGRHGSFCDIEYTPDTVVKTSRVTFPSRDEAEVYTERLCLYGQELADGPIAVAQLLGATVIESETGLFRIQHTLERITGACVADLPIVGRRAQVTRMIVDITAAPTLPGSAIRLAIPYDALTNNYHLNAHGDPVGVDIFPAMSWLDQYVTYGFPSAANKPESPYTATLNFGLKSGAVARLALGLPQFSKGESRIEKLQQLLSDRDWYMDLLPAAIHPTVRGQVGAQIRRLLNNEITLQIQAGNND